MKHTFLFLMCCAFLLIPKLQAQQLERVVISTTGGSFLTTEGQLDTSLGELVGITYQSSTITLTQGFLQPTLPLIPTSLEDVYQKLGFTYYPNPATISFQLHSEAPHRIHQIVFYSMSGRLVQTTQFGNQTLDISRLANGLYMVQALDREGISVHAFKLLKQ